MLLFFGCVKLIGHFAFAVNVVSSNPCVVPSPRIKISFPLLSIYTYELISVPKIMTFFPILPSANENCERESYPMPYPLYLYLSGSTFLVSFTDPNKEFFNLKSMFKFLSHGVSM